MADTISWGEIVHQRFKANGIRLVAHVPDAALVPLIRACEADPEIEVLQLTREEEGVGVLSGAYLGGTRGALGIETATIERAEDVATLVDQAIYSAFSTSQPVALLASTLLTGGKRA